jgi:hypothetical protein
MHVVMLTRVVHECRDPRSVFGCAFGASQLSWRLQQRSIAMRGSLQAVVARTSVIGTKLRLNYVSS